MDTSSSSSEQSPSSSDVDSEMSSGLSSELSEDLQEGVRQQSRAAKRKRYLSGKSRKVYRLRRELDKSLEAPDSTTLPEGLSSLNIMVQNLRKEKRGFLTLNSLIVITIAT
jgi:hypothetical protein